MLQIVGQNKRVDFDNVDIINSLKMLIQKFKELKEKHADLKDIIEDKERFNELFNVIGEILTTLRQSGEFNNETIEKLYNIYQNIMERYNNLYKNTIDNELNEVNEDTKLHTTPKFPFSEYGLKQPANEELKKIPVDIEKVDKENRRESIVKTEIVKLNVDIDLLIGALNKVIDIINKKYNISQEQTEPEIISSTELATIEKKSWFQKIIGRIKTFFGSEEKIVADVPYEEVGSKNKKFVKELRIEEKKDLPEEESSMSESEKEENFVEE